MAFERFMLLIALAACTSCTRTAVTVGSGHGPAGSSPPPRAAVYDDTQRIIPAGQELDVRLQGTLSSETIRVRQRFQTTTASDLRNGARVIVPAGSIVHGVVRGADKGHGLQRPGRLELSFVELVANGHSVAIDGIAILLFEDGGVRDERDSAANPPALTGGTLAALDRNVTTSLIAADGAIIAPQAGIDAVLAANTIIRIRLNTPVSIR